MLFLKLNFRSSWWFISEYILGETIIAGYIIAAFIVKDDNYKKAIGLGIVAFLTAFFSELEMMVAPFFLTVCFVMAFPDIF